MKYAAIDILISSRLRDTPIDCAPVPHPPAPFRTLALSERQNQKGKGEGGGSQGELGEGPGVVDLQRCWGCDEQSYQGLI